MSLHQYHNASTVALIYGYGRVETFLPYLETMCTARQWKDFNWQKNQKRFSPKQKDLIVKVLGMPLNE